jgi:hypothetical protein
VTVQRRHRIATAFVGVVTAATFIVGSTSAASAADAVDSEVAAALQRVGAGTWSDSDLTLIKEREPDLADQIADPRSSAVTIEASAVKYLDGEIGPQPVEGEGNPADTSDDETLTALTDAESAGTLDNTATAGTDPTTTTTPAAATTSAKTASASLSASAAAASTAWKWVDVWYSHKSLLGSTIYRYHTYVKFQYNGTKVTAWGTRYDYLSNEQDIVQLGDRILNQKTGVPASSATSTMKRHVELCVISYGCYANLYPYIKIKVKGNGSYTYSGSGG